MQDILNKISEPVTPDDLLQPGQEFAQLISLERSMAWGTATQFWTENKQELGCSYNRYVVIEKGTSRASLDLAIKIIRALKIPEDSGLFAWVRDLMTDEKTRSYFPNPNTHIKTPKSSLRGLSKAESELFINNEYALDLSEYIAMYSEKGLSEHELCDAFRMDKGDMKTILNQLLELDIIFKNTAGHYEVQNKVRGQLPDLPELRIAKSKGFMRAVESHFTTPYIEEKTLEISCVRLLSQRQIDLIRAKCLALINWISMLPDEPGAKPYIFCTAGNKAIFGNARKKLFKEDRVIEADTAWGQSNE